MIDLALSRTSHDLILAGNDLSLIDGVDLIRQRIKRRLLLILGEWFLAVSDGLPWFGELNAKGTSEGRVRSLLQRQIVGTPGVDRVVQLELDFNSATRALQVQFRVLIGGVEISGGVTV